MIEQKEFGICEFCQAQFEYDENKRLDELIETISSFDFCSCCGINRDELTATVLADVKLIDVFHPRGQDTCLEGCSHMQCGNYTSYKYDVFNFRIA